jgi:dienelactone hydrolase
MTIHKGQKVFDQAMAFYQVGEFQQAYDLLTAESSPHAEVRNRVFQWRTCMAAKMGKLDLAESILKTALDEGNFYSENRLRHDADLKGLQGRTVFEALVERDLQMLATAQKTAAPKLKIMEPKDTHVPVPLMMALHGNHANAEQMTGYWDFLTERGWLVALPQSSQVEGNDGYNWNIQAVARKEICAHYANLTAKFNIDPGYSLIAGFSMGGHTAIRLALSGAIPVKGFIGVAPFIGETSKFTREFKKGLTTGLRGYFLLGEKDEMCTKTSVRLAKSMNKTGIAFGVEVFAGIGHDFPEDSQPAIEKAIQFIFQE